MPNADAWIDSHRDEIISSLRRLIRCRSVTAPASGPNAPFGEGCREALDFTLELCQGLGFETADLDGYIGYADYGQGSETLGILAHLDVVPEGGGWKSGPYDGNIVDGLLIGRGALDDKGPAISAIYALAAVKASGLPFRRRVRLLFGCDEESSMRCLRHYIQRQPLPDLAFSPDAQYPLVNSEKNIYHASCKLAYPSRLSAKAGTVVNAVPGGAEATVPLGVDDVAPHIRSDWYTVTPCAGGARIAAAGAAAHASIPEQGANAIQRLLALLVKLPLPEKDAAAVSALYSAFKLEYHGESVGLDRSDGSGRLTLNLGLLSWDENGFSLGLDIRAPMMLDEEAITSKLAAALSPSGMSIEDVSFSKGYYLPEDCELVSKLLEVYRARTGDMTPPRRIGGGTYARYLKNAVAFGPEREGRDNRIHMADESIPLEDLIDNTKLIAGAIIALACVQPV